MAARAAQRARKPYLIAPRGMLFADLINLKSRWIKRAWIQLIERHNIANAAGVHVTTELEATGLRALGLKLPRVFCVPNGVQLPISHAPLSAGPFARLPRPYALFLSRINWKKGLDRLIRAWAMIPNMKLVIAGNDEENYMPKLKTLARQEGVADRVLFVGPVNDTEKWALYENAEVFILPSYSENFGNVVAEAMVMSCPVVVTSEVGLAEVVRSSGAGIVTSGEPKELAANISILLATSRSEREEMGRRGYRAAVEQLSWGAIALSMENMYLDALRDRFRTPIAAPDSD
jgi:glycosyltransferase involved in cell wall biosynthesis